MKSRRSTLGRRQRDAGTPGGQTIDRAGLTDPAELHAIGMRISGRLGWTHPHIAEFFTGVGLEAADSCRGLAPRALRYIQAGQVAGRFTVPNAGIALSAAADGLLGLPRMCQRHPDRVTESSVDQLAAAVLWLLGVPAPEAARLTAHPLPPLTRGKQAPRCVRPRPRHPPRGGHSRARDDGG